MVTFNKDEPAITQSSDWSCAPTSARWSLRALGRSPNREWLEGAMLNEGVVSTELGLMDASGAGLARWITEQYSEFGIYANSEPSVTFDGAALEGDHAYPLLIGGRNWGGPGRGHWTGVRGYDAGRDVLLLANPAGTSATYGGQEMTRAQFDARGPFSMVRVLHPDVDGSRGVEPPAPPAPPPAPEPPPLPPPAPKPSADEIRAGMRAILDLSDEQHVGRSIRAMLSDLYDRSR